MKKFSIYKKYKVIFNYNNFYAQCTVNRYHDKIPSISYTFPNIYYICKFSSSFIDFHEYLY